DVIDSMFFIPDGVGDAEYSEHTRPGIAGDSVEDEESVVIAGPQPAPTTETKPKAPKPKTEKPKPKPKSKNDGDGGKVGTPRTFKVVSQKITTRPDGSQFVDIAVDVDKVSKETGYEVRV